MITITETHYVENVDRLLGICRKCGAERDNCEPDAEYYPCEDCGCNEVFGTEQLLVMGELEFCEDDQGDDVTVMT